MSMLTNQSYVFIRERKMANVFKVFVQGLLIFLVLSQYSASQEPKCYSRFDYDEKLLNKLVKLEHKMHIMTEKGEICDNRIGELENRLAECRGGVNRLDSLFVGMKTILDSINKPTVAFHTLGSRNLSPKSGDKLVFKKVKVNVGGGYNADTGIFTAPVNGVYLFSTQICNRGTSGAQFYINVNGNPMTNSIQYGKDDLCSSAILVSQLSSGDHVDVEIGHVVGPGQNLFENVHRECMFSGVLVN